MRNGEAHLVRVDQGQKSLGHLKYVGRQGYQPLHYGIGGSGQGTVMVQA